MLKILSCFFIVFMTFSAMADHHGEENTNLNTAIKSFDHAYANNDVERYFSFYAADATVYFGDARQDVSAYHKMWIALMKAGGGVELNEMSDLKVQVMPGGDFAISTSFINNRTRSPDGTTTTVRAFETDVWQKIDGKWKIVSLHFSEIPVKD
jgi:ketosteroid isomerase-like protein